MTVINDSSHLRNKQVLQVLNKNHVKTNNSTTKLATSTDDLTFVFGIWRKALEWDICYSKLGVVGQALASQMDQLKTFPEGKIK